MLTILAFVVTAASSDTVQARDARAAYEQIFKIAIDSGSHGWLASARVDTLPTGHPLAPFVRERKQYLAYFATGIYERLAGVRLDRAEVRDSVRTSFYVRLKSDSAYERGILGALAAYLARRGGVLVGYAPPAKQTVALRKDVAVAARFYNPNIVLPDGRIGVHICTVENGLFRTLGTRDLALEALAFAAVWEDTSRPDSTALASADFDEAYKRVRALPRTGAPSERIASAQRTMWHALESGTGLPRLLRDVEARWPDVPVAFGL